MDFIYLPQFIKKIKELSKKYPSIKNDFEHLLVQLQQYPHTGTPLGKDCFKIRLAIKSKSKGKSGRSEDHYVHKDPGQQALFPHSL